ncbi:hypothetical protein [Streptomyces sp. NPDC059639]|uniref:hypothetical protein n=1 Tax=Streptomyces sp. NPDC059639 TaxID=3346891 RepID=UPI0036A3E23A
MDLHYESGTSTTGHTFCGVPARALLCLAPRSARLATVNDAVAANLLFADGQFDA